MHRRIALSVLAAAFVITLTTLGGGSPKPAAGAVSAARQADPVVLTGADAPALVGAAVNTIVGFRWTGSLWVQLPVQVDERAVVNFSKIYHDPNANFYGSQVSAVSALVYTSGNTWTGADPVKGFDSDDELAFMARDAGVAAPSGTAQPAGTATATGVEVQVTDPLAPGSGGYVYLFRKASGSRLVPSAHKRYVHYSFKLLAGGYKRTYSLTGSDNPENSVVKGASYVRRFSDRWVTDQLMITAAGKHAPDIIDRQKVLFSPGYCGRSEDTFDATGPNGSAEGAFIVNKVGPVRAIRSYIGANSGPSTQRTDIFYDRREDLRTDLRVHAIPSILDFVDYSPAAVGMTYRNSVNPAGVTIDGTADSLTAGAPEWEQVTGAAGTVTYVNALHTSFTPTGVTSYYEDNSTNPSTQCTGDAGAYGSSGTCIDGAIPCTDPGHGCSDSLWSTRTMFYDAPGGTAASAAAEAVDAEQPLQYSARAWS